jgi:hypothetical protein
MDMSISGVASYPIDYSLSVNSVNKHALAVNQLSNSLGIKPGGMYSALMNSLVNALSAAGINVNPIITDSSQVSSSSTVTAVSGVTGNNTVSGSSVVTDSGSVSAGHQQTNNSLEPTLAQAIAQFMYALMYSLQCMSDQANAASVSSSNAASSTASSSQSVSSVSSTSAVMVAASGNSVQNDLAALLNQLNGGSQENNSSNNSNNNSQTSSDNQNSSDATDSSSTMANSTAFTSSLTSNSVLMSAVATSNITPSVTHSNSFATTNSSIKGLQRAYSNLISSLGASSSRVPLTSVLKNFSAQLATRAHGDIVDTTS